MWWMRVSSTQPSNLGRQAPRPVLNKQPSVFGKLGERNKQREPEQCPPSQSRGVKADQEATAAAAPAEASTAGGEGEADEVVTVTVRRSLQTNGKNQARWLPEASSNLESYTGHNHTRDTPCLACAARMKTAQCSRSQDQVLARFGLHKL